MHVATSVRAVVRVWGPLFLRSVLYRTVFSRGTAGPRNKCRGGGGGGTYPPSPTLHFCAELSLPSLA